MLTLRPYQAQAIERLRQSIKAGKRRPVLQLPTGGGKTLIASEIISGAVQKGKRVIFTAPRIQLIDQTAQAFWRHDIREIGIMQANHPMTDPSKPVQIASIQTLARRTIPPADLVIIDECHLMSKFVADWMGQLDWADVPFIGLSATPWAKGMGRLYDHLIVSATTREMIDQGYLSPFRVFAPSHPDLSGVKTVAGDYHEGQLSSAMQQGQLTGDIVSHWLEHGEGRPTLAFAVDRAHAKQIQKSFEDAGVRCGYVDGNTPTDERARVQKAFEQRELSVVASIGVLTTGVDWDVRCIILARPTKSEILFVQIIGRGLRTAEGKRDLLIFDHTGTTQNLGFVTDIHHHGLSDAVIATSGDRANNEKPVKLPKECPSCHFLKAVGEHKCSNCGFEPVRQSDVESVPGELVELTAARQAKENKDTDWGEKAIFMGELRAYVLEQGYREGWAAMKYKEKMGVFPNDPRVKYVLPAREIRPATRAWIKSRQIAFAKRRAL